MIEEATRKVIEDNLMDWAGAYKEVTRINKEILIAQNEVDELTTKMISESQRERDAESVINSAIASIDDTPENKEQVADILTRYTHEAVVSNMFSTDEVRNV